MDADELYGLPLERFIAERTALAKWLRSEKRRDEAAEVAALRKPSVAAWAVNQLVRTQRDATKSLFDAGDALRQAQTDLLDGRGDGNALRTARERQRTAVEELVSKARGLLTSEGYELSPSIIERVGDTLHAAALDEAAREQVRDGRLERELRHVGLGLGLGEGVLGPGKATGGSPKGARKAGGEARGKREAQGKAGTKGTASGRAAGAAEPVRKASGGGGEAAAERRAEREREAREREQAERARRERAAARSAARAAEATAKRRATAASRALEAAARERDDAQETLREAEQALVSAREEAQAAEQALQRAQAELEAL